MKHVYFSFIVAIIITFFLSSNLLLAQEEDGCKTSSKKAEKYFNQAVSAMKSSNYPEAIKLFREAIDEDPDYAEAYYGLGKIYLRPSKFNLNLVKKYYKKVVELCPEYDIYCYYYLGDIYLG
ncbi:MAG TPA: tetratricopeptide repeat protein, partial [Bacteroidales bacterium]|nr:tetratricopeptide repeat protein [Bacteroidales bacterium]